jgi:hypothetical protein
MISQTSGVTAYNTIDQLTKPQGSTPPPVPAEQNNQGGSTVADKTDISAKALALSKTLQQPGATAEQQEPKAAEQGETREEAAGLQAPPQQPPPQQQQQVQQQSSPSINIRV